ncbi:hypothetical protein BBK14_15030 [Parafrankia soli]|uniref:Peptidoglycan binding-like domain-containing protein n=1 Tax=Parafrankia soli TaxID=2599596 RepID=A0A1S1QQH1_9ACTN|nr:hypothetical protein BBK14_15030 [Parafrankia soli]
MGCVWLADQIGDRRFRAAGTGFGPYYGIGAGERAPEGSSQDDIAAVRAAVKAIQRALNWHNGPGTPIPTDGRFTERTRAAVIAFQQHRQPVINRDMYLAATERNPPGLVHKETSYALFMPIADRYATRYTVPRGLLPDVTKDRALDPYWALDSTAKAMRERYDSDRWGHNWTYVIVAHNVPTWAAEWAQGKLTATNPDDKPKLDRMTGYLTNVLARTW